VARTDECISRGTLADYCTDPAFADLSPEERANPSRKSWDDDGYLETEQGRLPSHKFRRLHLNLPGSPEGSAYSAEKVMDSIDRNVSVRPPQTGISYLGFVDMSGGSSDDSVLAIAHKDLDGKAVLDRLMNQGQRPPFDPATAVKRFVAVLREYRCTSVTGDAYAGETFISAFTTLGISYVVSPLSKSEIYESIEPHLNAGKITLLDLPELESQLLGLIWRANKIDHANGEHDDWANACAGAIHKVMAGAGLDLSLLYGGGRRVASMADWRDQGGSYVRSDREPAPGTVTVHVGGGRRFNW